MSPKSYSTFRVTQNWGAIGAQKKGSNGCPKKIYKRIIVSRVENLRSARTPLRTNFRNTATRRKALALQSLVSCLFVLVGLPTLLGDFQRLQNGKLLPRRGSHCFSSSFFRLPGFCRFSTSITISFVRLTIFVILTRTKPFSWTVPSLSR